MSKGLIKFISSLVVCFFVCAIFMTGCGGKKTEEDKGPQQETTKEENTSGISDKKKIVIGFANYASLPYFIDMEAAARMTAEKNGVEFHAVRCEMQSSTQLNQVEDLVAKGINVLMAEIADPGSMEKMFKDLKQKGISLICCDLNVNGSDYWIASDDLAIGRTAGEEAVKLLTKKNGEPKGNIIMLSHKTAINMQNRCKGFAEVISKYPNIKIVDERSPVKFDVPSVMSLVEDLLQAHPKGTLDMIFASNEQEAEGSNAAIKSAKRDDILLVGVDDSQSIREALQDPNAPLLATVVQDPIAMGIKAVEVGIQLANGQKPSETVYRPPVTLVTKETINDYIAKMKKIQEELKPYVQ